MKIALIVGHNKNETGTYSQYLKSSESDFFNKVCEIIKRKAPSVVRFQEKIFRLKKDRVNYVSNNS